MEGVVAKTAAERQQARRDRVKASNQNKSEFILEPNENRMLDELCTLRRPGKQPYSRNEMIALLIIQSHRQLMRKINTLNKQTCQKCGKQLPAVDCNFEKEPGCWRLTGPSDLLVKIK
jgi:hypothetical protein